MNMNPRLPAPEYGYGRKRTESRRIEGPGSSEYILTHRHGSEYQKQSVFASAQPRSLPSRYNSHGHQRRYFPPASPSGPQIQHRHHDHHPGFDVDDAHDGHDAHDAHDDYEQEELRRGHAHRSHSHRRYSRASDPRVIPVIHSTELRIPRFPSGGLRSRDIADMDQRSPRGLTFGISLACSSSDKNSSVSFAQTSETGSGHDGVKGSKNTIKSGYKESIFRVLSSRYTNSLALRMPVEAELVLQPPPRPTEKSLSPLLTWM